MIRARFATCFVIATLLVGPAAASVSAQDSGASSGSTRASTKEKRAKRAKRGKRTREAEPKQAEAKPADKDKAEKGEASVPQPEGAASTSSASSASSALGGGEETVRQEGGTEVKTVEFTGLDIEGQLKTPQLLYFLTRLRAEFDRPRLPHRSFMPELQRTPGEKSLR